MSSSITSPWWTPTGSSCIENGGQDVGSFLSICDHGERTVHVTTHWLARMSTHMSSTATPTSFEDYIQDVMGSELQHYLGQAYQKVTGAVCDPCVRTLSNVQIIMMDSNIEKDNTNNDQYHDFILQVQVQQRDDCVSTTAFDTDVPMLTSLTSSQSSLHLLDDFGHYCHDQFLGSLNSENDYCCCTCGSVKNDHASSQRLVSSADYWTILQSSWTGEGDFVIQSIVEIALLAKSSDDYENAASITIDDDDDDDDDDDFDDSWQKDHGILTPLLLNDIQDAMDNTQTTKTTTTTSSSTTQSLRGRALQQSRPNYNYNNYYNFANTNNMQNAPSLSRPSGFMLPSGTTMNNAIAKTNAAAQTAAAEATGGADNDNGNGSQFWVSTRINAGMMTTTTTTTAVPNNYAVPNSFRQRRRGRT